MRFQGKKTVCAITEKRQIAYVIKEKTQMACVIMAKDI